MSNVLTFPVGGLEGVLSSIGEEINAHSGQRITRLDAAHTRGDTTITVETTFGWADTGVLYIAGTKYTYSGRTSGPDTFTGLQADGYYTTGLKEDLRELTPVADGNRDFSNLDAARAQIFVDTAVGEYLDALGRNLGVPRQFDLGDTQYRALIKAMAYSPRGTLYALELFLDLVVGVGLYTIFEDLVNNPNEVFITLGGAITPGSDGKTYLNDKDAQPSVTISTMVTTYPPLGADPDSVLGVFLAPGLHEAAFDVLPSAEATPWTYMGTATEATAVTDNGDGSFNFVDTNVDSAWYEQIPQTEATSEVIATWSMRRNSWSGNIAGISIQIEDGTRVFSVGWDSTDVTFFNQSGPTAFGATYAIDGNYHEYRLVKDGGRDPSTLRVKLYVDDVLALDEPYTAFETIGTRSVRFGAISTPSITDADWAHINFRTRDIWTNYWNERQDAEGTTSNADPDRLTSPGNFFVQANDLDRSVRVSGSTAAHGRGNGTYRTTAVDAGGAFVDLQGVAHLEGEVLGADQVRIPETWDPFTAEDAGVQSTLQTGSVGSNNAIDWEAVYGGIDGDQISVQLIDPAGASPLQVNVVASDDIQVTLAHNGASITSTANDVISAIQGNVTADALVNVSSTPGSTGLGVVAAVAATPLAGGEDGKLFTITGSGLGNDGTYNLATLIDERNALVGSHIVPAGLTVETGLGWRKDPNFETDTGITWEVVAAGTVSGTTLTFRRDLYAHPLDLVAVYTTVLTGQILQDEFSSNVPAGTYYPFYLADPLSFVRSAIDAITAAGVIPRFSD